MEAFKEAMNAKSLEEVIRWFLKERRKRLLEEVFGVDRNREKPFMEENRGEDRG